MLLQTNSYVVPKQHRAEHARLLTRFREALARVGCDLFEVYQQADANWDPTDSDGRFVQIMRFRSREHQQAVRAAERLDLAAQSLIEEFCRLINFPYQQEHGLFAVGFYTELEPEPSQVAPGSDAQAIEDDFDDSVVQNQPVRPSTVAAQESETESDLKLPRAKAQKSDSPPAEEELDELLNSQFAPASSLADPAAVGDPDLVRVLDAGLAFDDLDVPMEAELLDEGESDHAGFPISTPPSKTLKRPHP